MAVEMITSGALLLPLHGNRDFLTKTQIIETHTIKFLCIIVTLTIQYHQDIVSVDITQNSLR
jgi:hypothetical protein